jgi:SHS2 domain-containing protein
MVKKYDILEHTADAKFKAYGKSLEEAFINSASAMYEILLKDEKISSKFEKKFEKKAQNYEQLLFDFLDELLFLMDTESLVLSKINSLNIVQLKPNLIKLNCDASFDSANNYDIGGNIKAVTYSEIEIKENDSGFELQVVVDI